MLKIKEFRSKITNIVKEYSSKELLNSYDGWHNHEDDVLIFWAGSIHKEEEMKWKRPQWSIFPLFSALEKGHKIHIFSTSEEKEINNFLIYSFGKIFKEFTDKIKFTIIEEDELNNLNFPKIKRALIWEEPNSFFAFNYWILNNIKYKNLFLLHNDVIIRENVKNWNIKDFDFSSMVYPIAHSDKLSINYVSIGEKFKVDLDKYKKEHFHNGLLYMNSKSMISYRDFILQNHKMIIDLWDSFVFPEQEILKIWNLLNEDFSLFNNSEIIGTKNTINFHNNCKLLHYDCKGKDEFMINDNGGLITKEAQRNFWKISNMFEKEADITFVRRVFFLTKKEHDKIAEESKVINDLGFDYLLIIDNPKSLVPTISNSRFSYVISENKEENSLKSLFENRGWIRTEYFSLIKEWIDYNKVDFNFIKSADEQDQFKITSSAKQNILTEINIFKTTILNKEPEIHLNDLLDVYLETLVIDRKTLEQLNNNLTKSSLYLSGELTTPITNLLEAIHLLYSENIVSKLDLNANDILEIENIDINSLINESKVKFNILREIDSLLKIHNIKLEKGNKLPTVTMISDENQFKYSITNAKSLIDQCKRKDELRINLIFSDIEDSKEEIERKLKEMGIYENVKLYFVSKENFLVDYSKLKHVSWATNIRLYLPYILNEESTYYIDNDIVHNGDISELLLYFEKDKAYARRWSDQTDYLISLNKYKKENINIFAYYNAGAIHLPLQKMRDTDFISKFEAFAIENKENIKFADQDILNSTIEIIDGPWKMNICREKWPKYHKEISNNINYEAYHFLSRLKQWDVFTPHSYIEESGDLSLTELLEISPNRNAWVKKHNEIWNENIEIPNGSDLTFIISMTDYNENEIDYWISVKEQFEGEINFLIAFDGKISEESRKKLHNKEFVFSETLTKKGKISSIKNLMNSIAIDTKLTKIIDPDDKLDLSETKRLVEILKNNEINASIIHSFVQRDGENDSINFYSSLATYNTIHLTSSLYEHIWNTPDISKSSDCILGLLANQHSNIIKLDVPFYIYLKHNGISNHNNIKNIDQKVKYLEEIEEFIEFYENNPDINKDYKYNSSPSHSEIKWIAGTLPSIYGVKESLKKINSYFHRFKNIARFNEDRQEKQKWDSQFMMELEKIIYNCKPNSTSIIVTFYKEIDDYINYWDGIARKFYENNIEFYFLIDNPDFNISKFKNVKDSNIFVNSENIGKFKTIYNFLKKSVVSTSHFKVFDPDDYIIFDKFIEIDKYIIDSETIYKMPKNSLKDKYINSFNYNKKKHNYIFKNSFGTSWTILPTKYFISDKLFEDENEIRNWIEDQFLSLIPLYQKCKIQYIKESYYLYNTSSGMTNLKLDEYSQVELANSIKLFYSYWKSTGMPQTHPLLRELGFLKKIAIQQEGKEILEAIEDVGNKVKSIKVDKIEFVSFFDGNLVEQFLVMYQSLIGVYDKNEFVYNIGVDEETFAKFQNEFENLGINVVLFNKEMISQYKNNQMAGEHISIFTMARLLMFDAFPHLKEKSKVVYLDVDILINKKIDELYFDGENNFAFTNNPTFTWESKLQSMLFWKKHLNNKSVFEKVQKKMITGDYFNAGVIIINSTKKISGLFKSCITSGLLFDDQTLLNIFNDNEIFVLNDNFNNFQVKNQQIENHLLSGIKIFHFSGDVKPWSPKISDETRNIFDKTGYYNVKERYDEEKRGKEQRKINLLLTLYKPTKEQVEFWVDIYNQLINEEFIELYILIDGTVIDGLDGIEDRHIYKSKENVGKFRLLYNFIKENNDLEDYVKVCDPDDYISIKLLKEYKIFHDNKIIFTKMAKINQEPNEINQDNITKLISENKGSVFNSFGNSWTILPIEPIKNDKTFSGRKIYYHDDQLIGYIAYVNGGEIVEDRDNGFYLYIYGIGQTSYKNTPRMLEKVISTFSEIKDVMNKTNCKNPINWPGDFSYYHGLINEYNEEFGNNREEEMLKNLDLVKQIKFPENKK